MSFVLLAAGGYNLLYGAILLLAPVTTLHLFAVDPAPPSAQFWQCIGMIVGVFGLGYVIAASDPHRHWPIIFLGLLAKVFGAAGFLYAAILGTLPWQLGWNILANDLVWWAPFAIILWSVYRSAAADFAAMEFSTALLEREAIQQAKTNEDISLADLSQEAPVLTIFLRHFGCTFCRQAAADVAAKRAEIESNGVRLAFVHMGSDAQARQFFGHYSLEDVERISDPDCILYRSFGLRRGTLGQLFGRGALLRGLRAAVQDGHGIGRIVGDAFQMPGVFLIFQGRIIRAFRHESAGDRPDYVDLASCPLPAAV